MAAQGRNLNSQIERRVGKLEEQPALRGSLDQRARVAEEQTGPKNEIIAVAKSAESICQKHRASHTIAKVSAGKAIGFTDECPLFYTGPGSLAHRALRLAEVRQRCGSS